MKIVVDDLSGSEIAAFLAAHLEDMQAGTPPESVHALDLDGLRRPEVTFWSAVADDGTLVGCAAVKRLDERHGELKSMRVAPDHRGEGIGAALLLHVLEQARLAGLGRISLETGSLAQFEPARRLYTRHGFVPCEPFADYRPDPHSVYLTLEL